MKFSTNIILFFGFLILALAVFNGLTADTISPEFQRAEILSGMSGIGLMLVSLLLKEIIPKEKNREDLQGDQGFYLHTNLNKEIAEELAWGSHQILLATSAATILVWWNDKIILKRGIIGKGNFIPGEICERSRKSQKLISLVKTKLYPGRIEFDPICLDLPSIIVYPLETKGFVIVGGWTERSFTRSDEIWIKGWSDRLTSRLINKE